MPDPVSALGHAHFAGFSTIREIGPLGMITLRAKPDATGLDAALKLAVGTEIPERRQFLRHGDRAAGWMSPDEYLLILPYDETSAALAAIGTALGGSHHLAVAVSDARAVFRIEGDKADQVLSKLAPVDFATFGVGEIRRTRVAQVAAAFWREDAGLTLVCFRSVARYVSDLMVSSALPGSELDP